jgi:hypothetical protein
MSLVAAGVLGVVVGYGLALIRDAVRTRDCAHDCATLRWMLRQRAEQDLTIGALFRETEKLARQLVLQAKVDATRNGLTPT